MNLKAYALVVLICFSIASLVFFPLDPANAALAERKAGVKVGQWIRYGNFLALWGSEAPGASPTLDLLDVNSTEYVVNTVQNVSGTLVTFEVLTHYKNGSEMSSVKGVDINTGSGEGNMSFVSAGISAGDRIYTAGELYAARINSTSLRSYAGVHRGTSLLNATVTSVDLDTSTAYWTEFFWDRLTGVLVEQFWSLAYLNQDGDLTLASVEYEMIDNNVWLDESDSVAPVAVAGSDITVETGANVTFDGGGSSDNVGITSFMWNFGDGSSGSGLIVFHVFSRVGAYNVTLTVEDVGGYSASDVLVVTAREAAVVAPSPWLVPVGVVVFVVFLILAWYLLRRR